MKCLLRSLMNCHLKDFLTNATTKEIKAGDIVKVKFVRCDYDTTIQGCGVILSVN